MPSWHFDHVQFVRQSEFGPSLLAEPEPRSHSSPESMMPSPQIGSLQFGRHVSDAFAFPLPASHSSAGLGAGTLGGALSVMPSPHRPIWQLLLQALFGISALFSVPSSHCSPGAGVDCTIPSPQLTAGHAVEPLQSVSAQFARPSPSSSFGLVFAGASLKLPQSVSNL